MVRVLWIVLGGCFLGIAFKITKDLIDFCGFNLFFRVVVIVVILSAARGGEHHVVDEFIDALAISIIEDFTDHTLQESLVLKFHLFLMLISVLFSVFVGTADVFALPSLLLGLAADEAVDVS